MIYFATVLAAQVAGFIYLFLQASTRAIFKQHHVALLSEPRRRMSEFLSHWGPLSWKWERLKAELDWAPCTPALPPLRAAPTPPAPLRLLPFPQHHSSWQETIDLMQKISRHRQRCGLWYEELIALYCSLVSAQRCWVGAGTVSSAPLCHVGQDLKDTWGVTQARRGDAALQNAEFVSSDERQSNKNQLFTRELTAGVQTLLQGGGCAGKWTKFITWIGVLVGLFRKETVPIH